MAEILLATDSDLTLQTGEQFAISVAGGPGHIRDWVGIFALGAANHDHLAWTYLGSDGSNRPPQGTGNGVVHLQAPMTPGVYEVRFMSADGSALSIITVGPTIIVVPPFPAGSFVEAVQPDGGVASSPLV
jgi:hypothetical protein